ncbi:MAG: hypothetical protein J6P28_03890 [Treponema sp.]|nr:hypothetical protein [Treponema sp.]MBR6143884.1 hypothetical protein [Treponema sp.]MBR7080713.1 hypothetical protein [Treponema sp.]
MATIETSSPVCMGGGDCMGFGSGGFIWAFLIFALLMGNGGFGFGGNGLANAIGYENLATSAEVQRGFDNQNAMANQREILSAVNSGTAQSVAAANQVYHDLANNLNDKYSELARDVAGVGAGVAQAIANQCQLNGELKLQMAESFGQSRYENAMNTAATNATVTAIGQKILDKFCEAENKALQSRVNQLELDRALCGVVKYQPNLNYGSVPSPLGAGYGPYPFFAA